MSFPTHSQYTPMQRFTSGHAPRPASFCKRSNGLQSEHNINCKTDKKYFYCTGTATATTRLYYYYDTLQTIKEQIMLLLLYHEYYTGTTSATTVLQSALLITTVPTTAMSDSFILNWVGSKWLKLYRVDFGRSPTCLSLKSLIFALWFRGSCFCSVLDRFLWFSLTFVQNGGGLWIPEATRKHQKELTELFWNEPRWPPWTGT